MTTYPPKPLPYQLNQLLANQSSQLSYKGYEGTIFHIAGPQAPVLGAQTGVSNTDISGIDAPFRHLDNKGARQDGTTWYDTLYDPGEIHFTAELSGTSPSDMRRLIGSWWGAWDPTKLGKLCWFSPERGEWWANVRMAKNVQTQYKQDWYQSGRVQFNWIARNDDAFWQSVDSVCEYGHDSNVVVDNFNRLDGTDLGPNWVQTYTGQGVCASPDSNSASWGSIGGGDGSVINQYAGNGSESSNGHSGNDHQMITATLLNGMPLPPVGVAVIVSATGGTFTLTFGTQTTTAIAYNASTSTITTALAALSHIGSGNVTVTGIAGAFSITLSAATPGTGTITANGASLTGGTIKVSSPGVNNFVDFSTLGSAWAYTVHDTNGGGYTLSYNGHTTALIAWNAEAPAVQSALAALPGIGSGNVTVYKTANEFFGIFNFFYTIEFSASVSTASTLSADSTLLGGIFDYISIVPYLPNAAASNNPINPPTYSWWQQCSTGLINSGGGWGVSNGQATWYPSGNDDGIVNIYQTPTQTSNQSVSITVAGGMNPDSLGSGPVISLHALSDSSGQNYVYGNICSDKVTIGIVSPAPFFGFPIVTELQAEGLAYTAGHYTLECDGVNYNLLLNGTVICQAYDDGGLAIRGPNNQYTGFGGVTPPLGPNTPGATVTTFSSQDNFAHTFLDLWGRMDNIFSNQYGIRARFGYNWTSLSVLNAGTLTQVWSGPTSGPVLAGQTLSLQCGVTQPGLVATTDQLFAGTNQTPNQFQIYQNGVPLIVATGTGVIGGTIAAIENFFGVGYGWQDGAGLSVYGNNYRGWGFGMTAAGTGGTQIGPASLDSWSGGSDSGFITLSNMGDQPAWPRYLCYGPGTFVVGDVQSNTLVNFGPLLPGQVALLTTLPRLQGVVDMTPSTATVPTQVPTGVQSLIDGLVSFVANNNIPPLLEQFESVFGQVPPQGPLYSLLSGRFTTPILPMQEQVGPTTMQIPVQIQGGSSDSKVIAAITPRRRWPE